MGEYEPNDSRNVTLNNSTLPGEPPRTGPREGEARTQSHVEGKDGQRLNLNGEPVDEDGNPLGNPPASQSQTSGGGNTR